MYAVSDPDLQYPPVTVSPIVLSGAICCRVKQSHLNPLTKMIRYGQETTVEPLLNPPYPPTHPQITPPTSK